MRRIVIINFIMALCMIVILSLNTGQVPAPMYEASGYYVDPEGSDRNPGTLQKPWKTIQKAADSALPGSTVSIKEGTYYERIRINVSGNAEQGAITFTNYNGGKVILDGSQSSVQDQAELILIENQSNLIINGLELVNNVNSDQNYFVTGISIWGSGDGITISNCKIHQIWYNNISEKNGAAAIAVFGRDGNVPVQNLTIDGNEIWNIKSGTAEAVFLTGNIKEFHITDNVIRDNNNSGLAVRGDDSMGGEPVCLPEENNRVRNGLIAGNQLIGNSTEENPFYQSGSYSAAGILADGAEDVELAYNTCKENDIGIRVTNEKQEKSCSGILVRDNLIVSNYSSGLSAGGSGTDKGWTVQMRVRNNTLYGNDVKGLGKGEISIGKSHDLSFTGNIIYAGNRNLVVAAKDFGKEYIYNLGFNYNIYFGPGGAKGLRFKGPETAEVGLNMWKSKTGQDKISKIVDPAFANAAAEDFRLTQRSPAIDFSDPAYTPAEGVLDYAGNKRLNGKAVDCGAYESI
ncbi:DUF1565 domain-containing protein [Anoxybacterium hadale]|uniref:DUF1565 domain-containing protein n=1 Tax=Anoxybacterium hadale TaxID=3408580 RepID=A0ACD1A6V1_9FIRM|nr:DUF1565 domain-containing protein [Clostridiales bacterium]